MRVLVTADLHFSDKPRDSYRFEFVTRLLELIQEHNVNNLIILGDLTEEKDRHRAWLVNEIVASLNELSEACPIILLRGNHDALDPTTPFFQFSNYINSGRVTWINDPKIFEIEGLGRCCFLPHTNNYERDWEPLKKTFKNCSYIFAHATFKGVKVGMTPSLDGIPIDVFPKGSRVIAGDIHAPVKIGCVEYVGAPYTIDFGDDYEPRVLLLDGDESVSIPCLGRQKHLLVVDDIDDLPDALVGHEGDVVRVRVRLTGKEFHDSWTDARDQIEKLCRDHGCDLNSIQPVITDTGSVSSVERSARGACSDVELMQAYCTRMQVPDRILRVGNKFL